VQSETTSFHHAVSIYSQLAFTFREISNFSIAKHRDQAPGIAVFGLSFISLFAGMLTAKNKTSSLVHIPTYVQRFPPPVYASAATPMNTLQITVCLFVAFFLGLTISMNVPLAIVVLIPAAVLFIGIAYFLVVCSTTSKSAMSAVPC
jgi:hypothetical protein